VIHLQRATDYADGVLSGRVPACKWVKLAVKRQQRDLKRKKWKWRFDTERASAICEFIEALPHVKGRYTATIELAPWQCWILTTVFGWVDSHGFRRFRTAYLELPRKQGKSTLTSGVGLYLLGADGEPGAEVYSAATTRDQAKIVWSDARAMVQRTPDLRDALGVEASAHSIYQAHTGSKFLALSRDQDGNLDGLNVHGGLIDELHGHKDRGVWDVIETATGARAQSLIWAITTAGFNRAGICYEQRTYVTKILNGVHDDETYFGIIYTIDDEDDPFDPASWAKANPNYGVSVAPDDLERKASKARQMASAQNNFLTKHLNVWVNADTSWMNMQAWEACADRGLTESDFDGADCIAACDLATKTDIAPLVRLYEREIDGKRHFYAFGSYFLPEDAAEDGRNAHYAGWSRDDLLTLTPGSVTDFSYIEDAIREHARRVRLIDVAFDPWQASNLMQRLEADGMPVVEYRQTVQNMSEPMKELEALVLSGCFHHNGCPVLTWMVSNVVCHTDAKDNIYPRKEQPQNKIDGVVALIMALGRALTGEREPTEITQGFVIL